MATNAYKHRGKWGILGLTDVIKYKWYIIHILNLL